MDRLLEGLGLPVMATAALLRATPPPADDPTGPWTVECANAGHPPALLRTPDGEVSVLCDEHGMLLGTGMAQERPARTASARELPAGSELLLYTDGLVEQPAGPGDRGRDIDEGMDRLQRLWAGLPRAVHPADACRAFDELVVERSDDIAVLVVRLGTAG